MTAKRHLITSPATYSIHEICAEYEGMTDKEVESRLTAKLLDYLHEKEVPEYTTRLKEDKSKWKVLSSLQKSIRRGDVLHAQRAANALYADNPSNLYRRMSIIAYEDIGMANPELVSLLLTIKGRQAWIRKMGGERFTSSIVEALCLSVKDRTLTDIAYGAWISPETQKLKRMWVENYDPDELVELCSASSDESIYFKQIGLSALGGALHNDKYPKQYSYRDVEALNKCLKTYKMPTLLDYMTRVGAKRGVEGLAFSVPLLTPYILNEEVTVEERPLPDIDMIAGVPSLAYDKHVQEGKRAYAYFSKACKPVAEWLKQKKYRGNVVELIGSALFYGESGSLLDRMLVYPTQEKLFRQGLVFEANRYGLSVDELYEFYELVNQHHEEVNRARKRIIEGK